MTKMLSQVDAVFDRLLASLGCVDGTDALLISHWQDGTNPGFRIQVSRKLDGKSLTRFVSKDGSIAA